MRSKTLCDYIWELQDERDIQIEKLSEEYNRRIDDFILDWFDETVESGTIFIRNEKQELEFLEVEDNMIIFRVNNGALLRYKPSELLDTLCKDNEVFL